MALTKHGRHLTFAGLLPNMAGLRLKWTDIKRGEKSPRNFLKMSFVVMETHGGPEYAVILTDENGVNKTFDSIEEAEQEADDCQDGIVIEL